MSTHAVAQPIPASGTRRSRRAAGLIGPALGGLFVAGALSAFPLGADQPDADASAAQAASYWSSHSGKQLAAAAIFALATAALIGFGAILRDWLRANDAAVGTLANVAFAGIVVAAAGLLTNVAFTVAAADTAGDVSPQVTQTLSTLSIEFGTPIAVGFGLMMIGSGAASARGRLLPSWMGWLAVLVGCSALTPFDEVAFWTHPLWILVLCAAMYLRRNAGAERT
jgi:hypothetical protein